MTLTSALRPLLRTASLATLSLAVCVPAMATEAQVEDKAAAEQNQPREKFKQAQDMRYGSALYHYFQGNNFDALSSLMVAEARGGIAHHADNADLIKGGISLSFGLERQAAELLEQQLQKTIGDTRSQQDQQLLTRYRRTAWLKLAELNYRHSNWDTAAQQLEKSGALHQSSLTLNLALRSDDLTQAQQLLQLADLPLPQQVLGHINLAAAYARQQEFPAATTHYQRAIALVAAVPLADSELLILRDKAHIGAGYALALQERYSEAAVEFRNVRLGTEWSDSALLGLGWAAANGKHYQDAVNALQFLIQQDPLSPQVQEALVALPYSYEQLRRPRAALAAYQHAEQQYAQVLGELRELDTAVTELRFAENFAHSEHRYGWLEDAETPELIRQHPRYLQQILQSDRLQLQLSELRDLQQLSQVLNRWELRLPQFDQLIVERNQRRKAIVAQYQSAQYDQQLEMAGSQYQALKKNLAAIEQQRNGLAMLSGDAGELLELLQGAEARYAKLSDSGNTRPYQAETLRRARGLLMWQANEQYHQNLWEKRKSLRALDEQLQAANARHQAVDHVAARAPQLNGLRNAITESSARLQHQQQTLAGAASAIEQNIRQDLHSALNRERERVEQYIGHTRLAIARLYDTAMQQSMALPAAPSKTAANTAASPAANAAHSKQPQTEDKQ